jgi:pSer/pThr/pTyr-binding forkhead associated (FHA) protein
MEILCPSCANSNLSNARYCDQCAYELPSHAFHVAPNPLSATQERSTLSALDQMDTIVPVQMSTPTPEPVALPSATPAPKVPNVSGSAAPGMGSISRPQSPLPPSAFVRPLPSSSATPLVPPVVATPVADSAAPVVQTPWVSPPPTAGHTYIPQSPPIVAMPSVSAPGMTPQDAEKPMTIRASSSPKTVMLGTPGNPLLIPQVGVPSARLYGRRHGVLEETPIPVNAALTIGRFDPSSGPVDVDLSTYPSGESVSRLHARIEQTPTSWTVQDADSANGVYIKPAGATVFGPRLVGVHRLSDGDEIAFGNVMMVFRQN